MNIHEAEINQTKIDAVIVDTSALEAKCFDFLGINSDTVPLFFEMVQQKDVTLLGHPILYGEIKKHIAHSDLTRKPQDLQITIGRNKGLFALIGISPEDTIEKLKQLKIGELQISAFEKEYESAVVLGYPSPELIFDAYFATNPPFAESGNKKSEFPDAFVLGAIKDYLDSDSRKTVLVISNDNDWAQTLSKRPNVVFVRTIEDGLKTLQSIVDILPLFYAAKEEIIKDLLFTAECECFDLQEYELVDDIDIKVIRVSRLDDNIVPLRITQKEALIKCSAELSVDGETTVVDEDNVVFDPEDGSVLFTAYSTIAFKGATSEIECEVLLEYDSEDPECTVQVGKLRLDSKYCIELNFDDAEVDWQGNYPEDDIHNDLFDAFEDDDFSVE